MSHKVWMVTGGARSGKSRHALALAASYSRPALVATAEPFDEEMKRRIAAHRASRDPRFQTVEEPRELAGAVLAAARDADVVVVDCLTVWLGNLLHYHQGGNGTPGLLGSFPQTQAFLDLLHQPPCDLVVVTNELGMGIVPEHKMARVFRDLAGFLNQEVARRADTVVLMVSGLPVVVKPSARSEPG